MDIKSLTAHGVTYKVYDISHDLIGSTSHEKYTRQTRRKDVALIALKVPGNEDSIRRIARCDEAQFVILVKDVFVAFRHLPTVDQLRSSFPTLVEDNRCNQCGAPPVSAAICVKCGTILCQACHAECDGFYCAICVGKREKVSLLRPVLNPMSLDPAHGPSS